jgi:hypothetical protein
MIVDLSSLSSDLVISGVLAFVVGMASVMVYSRLRSAFQDRRYRADDAIVEGIVLEYTRRLGDYDKVLAELRADIDMIEVKSQTPQNVISQGQHISRQPQPHVAPSSEHVTITQHAVVDNENNGTTDYILKLLAERPRTSREVQHAVGRTREHTARLMKKLHDSGLVSRDTTAKPFRYNVTDAGRERLKEKSAPPAF